MILISLPVLCGFHTELHAQSPFPSSKQSILLSNAQSGASERWAAIFFPSTATANYRLILPNIAPTVGQIMNVASISGNDYTMQWADISGSAWSLNGNTPTASWNGTTGSFLGTTSAQPLSIATTNATAQDIRFYTGANGASERMRILGTNGNVGIGTNAPAELLDVAGDLRINNMRTRTMQRTVPIVVGDAVDIGTFTLSHGGGSFWISITVPSSNFSVAKQYVIPVQYNQSSNQWRVVTPTQNTGTYGGNDFELDANVNNASFSLRIRRSQGTTAGTAYIVIKQEGVNTDAFTASTTVNTVTSPTSALYANTSSVSLSSITAATATNSINSSNFGQTWQWNTLAGTSALTLSTTSTAAAGNAQTLLNLSMSGANATSTQTTYGAQISNTHTGTSSTNVGLSVSASGGTNNYGLLVPSGNVGIGTTTPGADLHVNNAGSTGTIWLTRNNLITSPNALLITIDNSGDASIINNNNQSLRFGANGLERVRIQQDGNVGIGTITPTARLHVNGTSRFSGGNMLIDTSAASTAGQLQLMNPARTFQTNIRAGAQTANITYTLPTVAPTAGQVLSSDASGNMSWITSGGGSPALSSITAATATNSINSSNFGQTWQWNTLAGTSALTLSTTSTAAAGNAQTLLNLSMSGANGTSTQTTYGAQISNTHTGTSSTNVGLSVSASGGTNNYGLLVPTGNVGIGTTTPTTQLQVHATSTTQVKLRLTDADVTLPNFTGSSSHGQFSTSNTIGQLSTADSHGFGSSTANSGGLLVYGLTASGVNTGEPLMLVGTHGGTAPTTPAVQIVGHKWDGTSNRTALTNTEPILDILNYASSTPVIRVQGNGNVGIGTPSPSQLLHTMNGNILIDNNDNTARELRFDEPSGSGTNYTAFRAQAQAANITYTLPPADGSNGQVLSTNGSGSLSWATVSAPQILVSVYRSSTYTVGTSYANLIYNTATINVGSAYNTSTGVFTAPATGIYQIIINNSYNTANGDNNYITTRFVVNGTTESQVDFAITPYSGATYGTLNATTIVSINGGQTASITVGNLSGVMNVTAGSTQHKMTIIRLQ